MKIRKSPNRHTDLQQVVNLIFSSAMYYNDQPPQMMYYSAKAIEALGDKDEAKKDLTHY